MKKLLYIALIAILAVSFGCAITDYPIITDDRGDFSGVIRTAHKAYVVPSGQVATNYADGSDELFTMVYQNQYGDQKLYTFNNFDPSGAVSFLDQTYCDWRYEGCEITRAWNPIQNDESFDYEFFEECSGARSLSLLTSQDRFGECGDAFQRQDLAAVFADLDTTTWRGEVAYLVPMNSTNTTINLTSAAGSTEAAPIFGTLNSFITDDLNVVVPMTPNARHQINWARNWASLNGTNATVSFDYAGVSAELPMAFRLDGLANNANRF